MPVAGVERSRIRADTVDTRLGREEGRSRQASVNIHFRFLLSRGSLSSIPLACHGGGGGGRGLSISSVSFFTLYPREILPPASFQQSLQLVHRRNIPRALSMRGEFSAALSRVSRNSKEQRECWLRVCMSSESTREE